MACRYVARVGLQPRAHLPEAGPLISYHQCLARQSSLVMMSYHGQDACEITEWGGVLMEKPLISVIIPVYNGERYLAEAIESILGQTYQPLEVIVMVDPRSTDE